jgi:dTMP kinase
MYDSFRKYQSALLDQFDHLAEEFHFNVIDARPEPRIIFEQLKAGIDRILAPPAVRPLVTPPEEEPVAVEELAIEEASEEQRRRA